MHKAVVDFDTAPVHQRTCWGAAWSYPELPALFLMASVPRSGLRKTSHVPKSCWLPPAPPARAPRQYSSPGIREPSCGARHVRCSTRRRRYPSGSHRSASPWFCFSNNDQNTTPPPPNKASCCTVIFYLLVLPNRAQGRVYC